MLPLILALALTATPTTKPATNTFCPVMGVQVDANSPVVVVRGREYRVCCMDCAAKLRAHPAQYLKADGTPKNEN
jgi:YHS domain-containing protein